METSSIDIHILLIVAAVALVATTAIHPVVLHFARKHNVMDNPNARKLQRNPMPVMGGVAVFFGIMAGNLVLACLLNKPILFGGLLAMAAMQAVGTWDDVRKLSVKIRFTIEILLVVALIVIVGVYIDNFHGLWGLTGISDMVAVPLSILSGVGIINAINLIDGIDGYSSGYGVMACICFAVLFLAVGNFTLACMAAITAMALVPFFFHNVFGIRSKMFIGDGGTLMLGMQITLFVFYSISSKSDCICVDSHGVSLMAFTLSVLCIPVFDTLRVMVMRILRGRSPFNPDKTHLHHLFIDMGFSHLGAGIFLLSLNFLVVVVWCILWSVGASVTMQLYAVVAMGLAVTAGFYKLMKTQQVHNTALWRAMLRLGEFSHWEKGPIWRFFNRLADIRLAWPSSSATSSSKPTATSSANPSSEPSKTEK